MDETLAPLSSVKNDEPHLGKMFFENRLWQKRFEDVADWNLQDAYMHLHRNIRRPMFVGKRPKTGRVQRLKRKQYLVNLLARMNRKDFAFDYFNRV